MKCRRHGIERDMWLLKLSRRGNVNYIEGSISCVKRDSVLRTCMYQSVKIGGIYPSGVETDRRMCVRTKLRKCYRFIRHIYGRRVWFAPGFRSCITMYFTGARARFRLLLIDPGYSSHKGLAFRQGTLLCKCNLHPLYAMLRQNCARTNEERVTKGLTTTTKNFLETG